MKQCMDAENLHRRLAKIIGQVQAIDRMVDEDVPCEDVLSQISKTSGGVSPLVFTLSCIRFFSEHPKAARSKAMIINLAFICMGNHWRMQRTDAPSLRPPLTKFADI